MTGKQVLWVSLFSLAVACGGNDGPVGDTSGAGGPDAAPDVTPPADAAPTASVTGLLMKPLPSPDWAAGIEMTVEGHPDIAAVVSGEDGLYAFPEVPPSTDLVVRGEKDGFVSVVSRVFNSGTGDTVIDTMMMLEETSMPLLADISAVDLIPGTGIIMGFVQNSADDSYMPGISATLSPQAGVNRYASETGFIDPALTETTSQGTFVVWHLDPGDYTVTAGSETNTSCRGTGLDGAATPTVRIYADTISHVAFVCD